MFANDNPVSNNSAVLADSNNQIGTIYCSSGSHTSGIGKWLAPNGMEITESSNSSLTVVRGGGNIPSYVGLQLQIDHTLLSIDEGVYTCIISDEKGVLQTLFVGIYRHGFLGKTNGIQFSVLHSLLLLANC